MFRRILSVLMLVLSCIVFASQAQAAPPTPLTPQKIAKIDALVKDRMAALKIPGAAITLIEDGEIVHAKGFGVTKIGGTPVNEHTPFQTGSVSKSFTALVIMQLAEEGRLGLDDAVIKYLPGFQTSDKAVSDTITVRQLLSHRSGFSTPDGNRNQDGGGFAPDEMARAAVKLASTQLKYAPGETYEYSNANYQVLGHLIETLTGQPYETVIETRIITPDRMPHSYVGRGQEAAKGAAQGYRYWFGRPRAFKDDTGRATLAQGGINASAHDLAAYLLSYMNAEAAYISEAGIAEMITPYDRTADQGYGLAWQVRSYADYRLIFHTGSNPGFETLAGFSPVGKFGFAVLVNTNSSFGTRSTSSLRFGVANLLMDRDPPPLGPGLISRIGFWTMFALPLVLGLLVLGFLRKYRRDGFKPLRSGRAATFTRLVLPSLILFVLAYALLILIPHMNGAPLPAAMRFNPDVGWILAIGGGLALIWGILRPVLRWRKR